MGFFDSLFGSGKQQPTAKPSAARKSDPDLIAAIQAVASAQSSGELRSIYNSLPNRTNPAIELQTGGMFEAVFSDPGTARDHYVRGASECLSAPTQHWDSPVSGSAGECLARLFCDHSPSDLAAEDKDKLVSTAYVLLSRGIELQPVAFDSLRYRYRLASEQGRAVMNLIYRYMPFGFITHVLCVSDAVDASTAFSKAGYHDDAQREAAVARSFHDYLDDMSINGRDADDYELNELAEIGRDRHRLIASSATQDYLGGAFNTSQQILAAAFL